MMYFNFKNFEITPKTINTLKFLIGIDFVTIGLPEKNYEDNLYILQNLTVCDPVDVDIVKQIGENPENNIVKYKCNAISTNGPWEEKEIESIVKLGITKIDVKFKEQK